MADPQRPNILYIMADQMAAPMLHMYNKESVVKTPHLDRLAAESVVFDSAYCNSPLCAPSRFTMVTGQLPSRIGGYDNAADLPADIPTYAHYLRQEGYHTALAGKMHFCGPDQLHGFEERLTSDIYPGDYGWSVNWDEPEVRTDWYHDMASVLEAGPIVRTNQLDYDEEVIFKSTQWLHNHVRHNTGQPFSLTVSMTHPHDPYAMTREFWDLYEDVDIPLPTTPAIPHDKQDPHSQRVLKCIDLWGQEMPEQSIRNARRAYFAACTFVDAQIGKLMKVLADTGLDQNTIVVFSGDHGDMLGERGMWYKMLWYEMSARVPMLVYAPGRYAPRRVSESVSTMDLMPTFVQMIGKDVHPQLPVDGVSLMPYLAGTDGPKPDTVLGEYMGEGTICPVVMIRRGPWKFVYAPTDPPQLYNLVEDPLELNNLAAGYSPQLPSTGASGVSAPAQRKPLQSDSPPRVLGAVRTEPTPPDTPNTTAQVSNDALDSKSTGDIVQAFLAEVAARWDLELITKQVLASQRRRRLVYDALAKGIQTTWEFVTPVDPAAQYIRNQGKIPLLDVETYNRWPRPAGKAGGRT